MHAASGDVAKRDPRVSEYIAACRPFARPILKHLRKVLHDAGPTLEETVKWKMPTFLHQGRIVCGFAGFKAHCALWFWEGKAVVPGRKGEGMGNFGCIGNLKELPPAATIKGYVRKAMKRIDDQAGDASRSLRRPAAARSRLRARGGTATSRSRAKSVR
jgi:hypothetical protein